MKLQFFFLRIIIGAIFEICVLYVPTIYSTLLALLIYKKRRERVQDRKVNQYPGVAHTAALSTPQTLFTYEQRENALHLLQGGRHLRKEK